MFVLFIHYTVFLIFLMLGIYVVSKANYISFHKYAALLFFNCSIYSLSFLFMSHPGAGKVWQEFFTHIGSIANFLISWLLFFTVLAYIKNKAVLQSIWVKSFFYLSVFLVVYFQFAGDLAVAEFYPELPYFIADYPNKMVSGIFQAEFYLVLILAFYLLFHHVKRLKDKNKKVQAWLFLASMLFTLLAGLINLYLPEITGYPVPILVDAFYLMPAGAILYMIAYKEFFDVTPTSLAKNIIELMPPGLVLVDNEGYIVTTNQALKGMFKLKKSEITGKKFITWINEMFSLSLPENDIMLPFRKQLVYNPNKNEIRFYIASFSFITNTFKQTTSSICVFEDITEVKHYEKELKTLNSELEEKVLHRTRELEISQKKAIESDALKTSFIQNLSHEIRTPLNGIIGFSDLLTRQNPASEKNKKFTDIIHKSSIQLISIVEDVIAVSNLETSSLPIEKTNIKLTELFNNLRKALEENHSPDIRLSFELPPENEEMSIYTDKEKLYIILYKLLDNGIKFSGKGKVTLRAEISDSGIGFYIKDEGIGIEKDLQEKIYNPFWQSEQGATRNYGGIGLGLTICKAYIALLGSELTVESEPGKGAIFSFLLPQ